VETTPINQKKRIYVLNVPVDVVSPEHLEGVVKGLLSNNETNQIVLITLRDLLRARRNKEYFSCLNTAALVLPISPSILRGAKFLLRDMPIRYMPFEFAIKLLGILEQNNGSLYLIGQRQPDLQVIESNLRDSFPGLRIVGRCNGYFKKEREEDIILAIRKAAPSLLLAGRGIPQNDLWITQNKKKFSPGLFFYCGECFDIISGRKQRPPKALWNSRFYYFPDLIKRPWLLFGIFIRIYYGILLLFHRIWKL